MGFLRCEGDVRDESGTVMLGLPFFGRRARVPDPGQCVGLLLENGSWRQGFRAVSPPTTAETGEVVIWVATEDEYRSACWSDREAVGMPWPVDRISICEAPAHHLPSRHG